MILPLLLGSLACEDPKREPPLDLKAIKAGVDPSNPRILALVAHFEDNGIRLVHERGGWWRVTRPANPDFDVILSLRTFPPGTSVSQAQEALMQINLAYMLNPSAMVAMSHPSFRGTPPDNLRNFQVIRELERLFRDYRPASGNPDGG